MAAGSYGVTLVVLAALVACVLWVLRDARVHERSGRPVAVYVGDFGIERPEVWAGACLVLWVLFFPLYLRARAES